MTAPAIDVEITALEEVSLEAAPPCDMNVRWRLGPFGRRAARKCGRPSTHRVKVTCPVHGTTLRFVCRRHLRVLRWGLVTCRTCDDKNFVRFGGYS